MSRTINEAKNTPYSGHADRAVPGHNDAHRVADAPHHALEFFFPKGAAVVSSGRLVLVDAEYIDPEIAPVHFVNMNANQRGQYNRNSLFSLVLNHSVVKVAQGKYQILPLIAPSVAAVRNCMR